jgi:hypothetical protein
MKDFIKMLADISRATSFREVLQWDDALAERLAYMWKRDIRAIQAVPKSLRASYMAGYLAEPDLHLIHDLTNWLIENGVLSGDSL